MWQLLKLKDDDTPQQTRVYCWANVVDGGPTVNQRWANISCLLGHDKRLPMNMVHRNNVALRLAHRLRQWYNIKPTMYRV